MFNINNFLHLDALKPAVEWKGFPKYNFVGGHIDGDSIPVQPIRAVSYTHLTLPTN